MPDLVPLKIKILHGRHPKTGKLQHLYPDLNRLPSSVRDNMDWSEFFDSHGIGWHYDCCGFGETDEEIDDPDAWHGYTCVPESFALAAIAEFPDLIEEIDETEFERVHDNRCHHMQEDEIINEKILNGIQAKRALGLTLTEQQQRALDPDDPTPGITKNKKKRWADYKQLRRVTIVPRLRKQDAR